MIRRIVVLSIFLLSFFGFSFAANDNISCSVNYTDEIDNNYSVTEIKVNEEKPFICQNNQNTELSDIPLQIKNLSGSVYKVSGEYIVGDIWYNNKIIKKQTKLLYEGDGDVGILNLKVNNKEKTITIFDYSTSEIEKFNFDGSLLYKLLNIGSINPYIRFENDNYATRIYFSDASKKYITNPTNKNKYNGLYMQIYNKSTKKIIQKKLYGFSSIPFNDIYDYGNDTIPAPIFNIDLDDDGSISNIYTFHTNTRNIKVDINNPLNPVVTKITKK